MTTKVFEKKDWVEALQGMRDSYKIIVPVKEGDYYNFRKLEEKTIPNFDFQNSRLSAKSAVYPQSERMFECLNDGDKESESCILQESPKDYSPQAIIGIRPCDAHAFQIVKRNFDNSEFRDPWWVRGFESTILVGLGCDDPCSTCFCNSVGGGPFHEEWLDAILYDIGGKYLAKPLNKRGEDFIGKIPGGTPADDSIIKKGEAIAEKALGKIKSDVPTDKLREKEVKDLFDAPFWEQVAFPCINCGTCTFLCPTCWCFDIQDEVSGNQVDRIRNWDTCMSPLFTLEGSGHNPRNNKLQRVRQRFMHKLKYYVDKYDNGVQCSGCGRCVRYCPVNIDIRHVAELMNGYNKKQ